MKKIMAVLLSLAMILGCAAALAEGETKQSFGTIRVNGEFTLKGTVPEGYRLVPFELSDSMIISYLYPDDPSRPELMLSIGYDELYADVDRLNDLDDEALAVLEATFTRTDPYAVITYDETGLGTRLMICRTMNDYSDYMTMMSIYKGYMVEISAVPGKAAETPRLTDEQIRDCNTFLTQLDFIAGAEEEMISTANVTYEALITGFDVEAKTAEITLLEPYTFTEWQLVSVGEGDRITIGEEEVEIGTLAYPEDDDPFVIINDEYAFTRREDGLFTATLYDMPVMKKVLEMTEGVPDGLKFMEGVDPETGIPLEQAAEKTAADLFAALELAQGSGISFDSQNVRVTFGENGELTEVDRYYTPWQ